MCGAPIAEETGVVGVRVFADDLEYNTESIQFPSDKAGQVEQEMSVARRGGEEIPVGRGPVEKPVAEFRADFVGLLLDAGPDSGGDVGRLRAQAGHRLHRGFDNPRKSAFPAGMGGADHAGLRIGKKHRCAIGRQHAQRQPGTAGDLGVCLWRIIRLPGVFDKNHIRRMNLIEGQQFTIPAKTV